MQSAAVREAGAESAVPVRDEIAIQQWLGGRIAELLGSAAEDIDITLPFSYYGLDSVAAVSLSGELENWLGVKLAPTLTWDYPSIELLARYLAGV